jgi:hypothetical protein
MAVVATAKVFPPVIFTVGVLIEVFPVIETAVAEDPVIEVGIKVSG